MPSKLKLRNNLETELEIVHPDNRTAKSISSTDIAVAVNTISNLPTNASNGDVVIVRDYHSGIEGGGGTFVYDSTRAKSEHNGGTIIDSTVAFPVDWSNQVSLQAWFDGNSVGTGCWVRKYDGAVNVKWFGAKGASDLSSLPDVDNTPYIVAAMNALPTLGGKIIVDKHYMCKTTIEIHDKIGVTIQGIGGNTSCSFRFTEDVICISIKSTSATPETCYGHSIKDLWVSGYKDLVVPSDGTYPVIRCEDTMLLTLDNVYLEDGGQQLFLSNVNSSNFSNIKLEGKNSLYIRYGSLSNTFSNIIIINDGRGSNSTYGMMLDSLSSSSIKFASINLRGGASDYGIYVKDSGRFAMTNAVIRNFDQGIMFENSNYNTFEDIKVTNSLGCVSFSGTSNNNKILSLIAEDSNNTVTFLSGSPTDNFIEVVNYKNITTATLASSKADIQYRSSYTITTGTLSADIVGITSVPYVIPFDTLTYTIDNEDTFVLDGGYIKINASGLYQFNIQADFRLSSTDTFNSVGLVESSNTSYQLATSEGSASTNTTVTPNLSIAHYCNAGEKYTLVVSSNDTSFNIDSSRTKLQILRVHA